MAIDLDREAATVRANGARLQGEGWLSETCAPSRVAAYVAASERVEALTPIEVIDIVKHLRELSPLYEMVKEGIDLTKIQWAAH